MRVALLAVMMCLCLSSEITAQRADFTSETRIFETNPDEIWGRSFGILFWVSGPVGDTYRYEVDYFDGDGFKIGDTRVFDWGAGYWLRYFWIGRSETCKVRRCRGYKGQDGRVRTVCGDIYLIR